MRCPTLMALLAGVMLYLVMGALVFRTLETPQEIRVYESLLNHTRTFLKNYSCVNEQAFNELIKGVVSAMDAGLDLSTSTNTSMTSRWDLSSAFFFCGTIITTIGFGNLSPRTWFGQLFCVCYALVGIPMFGILLAGVGDHMGTMLRKAVAKIETLFLTRKVRPTTVRVISALLSILIGCLIFLAVPMAFFKEIEEWTFLEALYFVVITLTTVGFGDYVPGGKGDAFFKPLVWLWIVFGLAYFASILTMIGNWLKVLSKKTRAEMEELRAHATDWTQNIQNMSVDFRIPNPLEFNDPFLLQRRRWKRSERRRVRRGAQGTLGYWVRDEGSENGHLPNRWVGLSCSMSRLEVPAPSGRRTAAGRGPGFDVRVLARSLSLPVARSTQEAGPGELYGSGSLYESRSSSSFSSGLLGPRLQPCQPISGAEAPHVTAEEDTGTLGGLSVCERASLPEDLAHTPSPPCPPPSAPACQLLDFFGENLAYIDESSDTLSDRAAPDTSGESARRARKPKKRSMRRQLPHRWSPLKVRKRLNSDTEPPSNPPTPPPQSPGP